MNTTIPKNARLITAEEAATLVVSCGRFVFDGRIQKAALVGTVNPPVIAGTDLHLFALLEWLEDETLYICLTKDEANKYQQIAQSQKKLDLLRSSVAARRIDLKGSVNDAHGHVCMQDARHCLRRACRK